MATDGRNPYGPQQREAALAIYQEHGPAVASRETGIKRGTISSWAKRAGLTSPQASRTKAATQAAQEWARRRVSLRDLSGEAAEEFLAAAREKMQTNARAATDHMRSFSIAVTTANTLAAQTAGESTLARADLDAEIEEMLSEVMGAARQQVRTEVLAEPNGTGDLVPPRHHPTNPQSPQPLKTARATQSPRSRQSAHQRSRRAGTAPLTARRAARRTSSIRESGTASFRSRD